MPPMAEAVREAGQGRHAPCRSDRGATEVRHPLRKGACYRHWSQEDICAGWAIRHPGASCMDPRSKSASGARRHYRSKGTICPLRATQSSLAGPAIRTAWTSSMPRVAVGKDASRIAARGIARWAALSPIHA